MRKFSVELGSVPCDEEPTSLGDDDYPRIGYAECLIYRDQLQRQFASYEKIRFSVKGFDHDYGRYYEVVVSCDSCDEAAVDQCFDVENNLPLVWDQQAKEALEKLTCR
jgi:hypothetical protein